MKVDYAGGTILPEEVVRFLFLSGRSQQVLMEVMKAREVRKKAVELGLSVSDEELQAFCDNYRKVRGLSSRQATLEFFKTAGITEDDFEAHCEAVLLAHSLKEYLAGAEQIEQVFVENRAEFDRARVSMIRVQDRNLANEIFLQATEDGEDFHALARKFSTDEATKYAGGYLGEAARNAFSVPVSSKIFNASAGDVLGPLPGDGFFVLFLVEEVIKAELTEAVKQAIKERIFDEWLSQFLRRGIAVNP